MGFLQLHQSFRSLLKSTLFVSTFALFISSLFLSGFTPNAEAAGLTGFRDTSGVSTGQTLNITLDRPTETLKDDVMVASITILLPGAGVVITPPSADWILIRQDEVFNEIAQALFYKVSKGDFPAEPLTYTFTHNQSREASGAIASYWNIDTSDPIDGNAGQFNSGTTPTAPSISPTVSGTTLVAIFGTKNGTVINPPVASGGLPADMVERWQQTGTNGIQGFDEHLVNSGATGDRTSSTNASSTMGQMIALRPAAATASGTVLFATRVVSPLTDAEQVRIDLITSWGFTVRQIYSNATQAEVAAELAVSDAVYISEETPSNNVRDDYTASCVGVVNEEPALVDFLLMAGSTSTATNDTEVRIGNTGHYITEEFLTGPMTIFTSASNKLQHLNGVASGAVLLAYDAGGSVSDTSLATYEIGVNMTDDTPAAGRRVSLPWGASQMSEVDILNLTANGQQIMRRSIEWAMASNSCTGRLIKRAFLPDGTPLPSGETVPSGNRIKFLIYLNNSGATESDVSVQDVLDPLGFLYDTGTIKIDNTYSCASNPCSATDETNIFAAIDDNTALTDTPGDDVASFTGGNNIDIGNSSQSTNAQLDMGANSVLALLFTVQMQ